MSTSSSVDNVDSSNNNGDNPPKAPPCNNNTHSAAKSRAFLRQKSCKSIGTKQSERVLYQKRYKYKARHRNKYIDPAVLINKLEREKAKMEGRKAEIVCIPNHVKEQMMKQEREQKRGEKRRDEANNCELIQQKRHEAKMANSNELIFKPLVQIQRNNNYKKKHNNNNNNNNGGINKTAYLFPKRLSCSDSSSFVNKYKNDLLLKIILYPEYRDISCINIRQTAGFQMIDEWFIEERDQRKPFSSIVDDYELIKKWQNDEIKVAPNAYSHCDRNIKSNRNALKTFKSSIRRFCGGANDSAHHATMSANYMFIESVRLNAKNSSPPSKVCIQCGLSLQCLPLLCIGEATVFTKKCSTKYRVYLYYVAMICENYPLCTFPRSRTHFDKHWCKIAWFNDINGKEFKQRKPVTETLRKKKRKRKASIQTPHAHKRQKTQKTQNNNNHIDLTTNSAQSSPYLVSLPLSADMDLTTNSTQLLPSLPSLPLLPLMPLPFLLPPSSSSSLFSAQSATNSDHCLSLPDLETNWLTNNMNHRLQSRSPTSPLSTPEACLH